jgi:hypothetical protein
MVVMITVMMIMVMMEMMMMKNMLMMMMMMIMHLPRDICGEQINGSDYEQCSSGK